VNYLDAAKQRSKFGPLILSLVLPQAAYFYYFERSIFKVSLLFYSVIYFIMSVGSSSIFIYGVSCRLKTLNEVLEYYLKRIVAKNDDETAKTFMKLMEIYSKTMIIRDDINLTFGLPMMLGFGYVFFSVIFSTFTAFMDITGHGQMSPLAISSNVLAAYYSFFVVGVIYQATKSNQEVRTQFFEEISSEFLSFKAKKILRTLRGLLKQRRNPLETSLLVSFGFLVDRRPPKFTCGLFDFDWKLIYSIIASASTNFVILMQFDLASRQKGNSAQV
jgi:hypothetical protein